KDVLRREGGETDAALGTRWGHVDLCGAAGCLRDYRAAAAGSPSAAPRPPGVPGHLAAGGLPRARALAQRRTPRDRLEVLWPVCAPPAHRGVGHRIDRRLCAAHVGPWGADGRDWRRCWLWDDPVWHRHDLLNPRDRRRPTAHGAGTYACRAGGW